MAIELNYNDVQQAQPEGAAAPEAEADTGSGNAIASLNDTLREVNELMDNMQQVQQKATQMQGGQPQAQQQAAPAGDMQGGVQQGQPTQDPTPNGGADGQKQAEFLDQMDSEQVYGFLTDAVLKIEDDIGEDATMQDLEEYMVENKEDILQLVEAAKTMIANGQAEQLLQGGQ